MLDWNSTFNIRSKNKTLKRQQRAEINYRSCGLRPSTLAIRKEGDQYKYGAGGTLRPANDEIKHQIEEHLAKEKEIASAEQLKEHQEHLHNLALKAVVTHDPENWGKGYLVHGIKSSETN